MPAKGLLGPYWHAFWVWQRYAEQDPTRPGPEGGRIERAARQPPAPHGPPGTPPPVSTQRRLFRMGGLFYGGASPKVY